jgi:Endomembrane protein 70
MTAGQQADIEESGWKMVSGDVFRTPKEPLLLCVEVGSGVQICSSAFITLLFAALGERTGQEPSCQAQDCCAQARTTMCSQAAGARPGW